MYYIYMAIILLYRLCMYCKCSVINHDIVIIHDHESQSKQYIQKRSQLNGLHTIFVVYKINSEYIRNGDINMHANSRNETEIGPKTGGEGPTIFRMEDVSDISVIRTPYGIQTIFTAILPISVHLFD